MGGAGEGGGWPGSARRIAASPQAVAVLGLVLGLAAVVESLARIRGDVAVRPLFGLVLCLLALATTLPLAFARRPGVAAIGVCAAGVLSLVPFHSLTVAGAGVMLIALYQLALTGPPLLAAALAMPFLLVALALSGQSAVSETRILTVLLAALAPAAAWAGAARRAHRETAAHTAARQVIVGSLLEHTARGERARIARELHDVVAHHISMIAVQAETARLTTTGMPPSGASQLSAIGDTARTALTEMRLLLGVLREDAAEAGGSTGVLGRAGAGGGAEAGARAERQPQPGLRELNQLLDQARAASGTGVRLIIHGPPDPLDPGVELAAYRIVQEALTNARRHAPGAAVDVELHYSDDAIRVRIRDNGPGPALMMPVGGLGPGSVSGHQSRQGQGHGDGQGHGHGHGVLGMRERALAVGGQLFTGPAVGGGFLVETVLPAKPDFAG